MTHTLLGAAVALPIAVSADPAIAAGCLWFGVVGGGLPDWLDLRSDFKTGLRLKHRGASHSVFTLGGSAALLYVLLELLRQADIGSGDRRLDPSATTIQSWAFCFALGVASHLLSDACTISGIMPFAPVSRWRFWLLPRFLRGRSTGVIDSVARILAIVVLSFGLVVFLGRWIPPWQ